MTNRRPPAQPPRRQHGDPTRPSGGPRPPTRTAAQSGARRAITAPAPRPKAGGMGRWTPAMAAAAVVTVIAFVAVSGGDKNNTNSVAAENPGVVNDSLTVPATTAPQVVIGPDTGEAKTNITRDLKKGHYGDDVRGLQMRLTQLGFDPNGIDGSFGSGTEMAVWAFEGLVYGTPYAEQTGVVTNEMWQKLQDPITFRAQRAEVRPGGTHMEIYLPIQAAIVYTDGMVRRITHISSGSGEEWCEVTKQDTDDQGQPLPEPILKDVCGVSKTPGGVFKFYRRYEGKRLGPLGGMMNPVYFNYGIAVHGADNVPKEPASHGCIRIPQWMATYFPTLVANGDYVYVWGFNGKQPEENTKDEMLPVFNRLNPNSTLTTTTTTTTIATSTTKPTQTTKATTTTAATTTTETTVPGP